MCIVTRVLQLAFIRTWFVIEWNEPLPCIFVFLFILPYTAMKSKIDILYRDSTCERIKKKSPRVSRQLHLGHASIRVQTALGDDVYIFEA